MCNGGQHGSSKDVNAFKVEAKRPAIKPSARAEASERWNKQPLRMLLAVCT